MMCSSGVCDIQYLYISDKSLSHFRSDFLKKKLWSDLHHKFEKHIIQGVYKGGALGALTREAKFKQDAKIYSDCF